jgi:hypothetical protein
MKLALLALVAVTALYGLHRLALWAERRGWIYYRRTRASPGTVPRAVLEVQSLFEPSKRYVLEQKARDQVEDEDGGDPPRTP